MYVFPVESGCYDFNLCAYRFLKVPQVIMLGGIYVRGTISLAFEVAFCLKIVQIEIAGRKILCD